jgi:CxxC motif-containing protein (DUF1111 family)
MMVRPVTFAATLAAALLLASPGFALDEAIGRALFRRAWVPAPSSTKANAGLGPLFNARSCAACHGGLDRAAVETDGNGLVQSDHLVLRFSDAAGKPDPVYGRQLQPASVAGAEPEGRVVLRDGRYEPHSLAYGSLAAGTRSGALLSPLLRGLGALESIPDAVIAEQAEKNSVRPDGIRGRVRWAMDARGERRVGRFGWKASHPTLDAQVETAFLLDLGLSTPARPLPAGDCTDAQITCIEAPHGGRPQEPAEISHEIVSRISAYLRTIKGEDPKGRSPQGAKLFASLGCAACHNPSLPGAHGPVQAYTDLLLHDMGPELDGGATEPGLASTEWRTAPLWGLSRTLANGSGLLHDGRAATLAEAIRHHGGEASGSRQQFDALTGQEQQALIDYLKLL